MNIIYNKLNENEYQLEYKLKTQSQTLDISSKFQHANISDKFQYANISDNLSNLFYNTYILNL